MTPENKIKRAIMQRAFADDADGVSGLSDLNTDELVSEAWWTFLDENDGAYDYRDEFRCGEVETNLPTEYSRHYESKAVAAKMDDGSWVGWTFWYGGGKYGEPGAIYWMNEAYDLDCVEEQKLVTVRTFTVKGKTNG